MKQSNNLGCAPIFGFIFVVLKLCGVISWSWWWVLAPFWVPLALAVFFYSLAAIMYFNAGGEE